MAITAIIKPLRVAVINAGLFGDIQLHFGGWLFAAFAWVIGKDGFTVGCFAAENGGGN